MHPSSCLGQSKKAFIAAFKDAQISMDQKIISSVFHYYASLNDPMNTENMSKSQFRQVLKDAHILPETPQDRSAPLKLHMADLIYVQATSDKASSKGSTLTLNAHHFKEALHLIADRVYANKKTNQDTEEEEEEDEGIFTFAHIHILIYSHTRIFTYSDILIYSYTHIFIYSVIQLFSYSVIHIFAYSVIHIFAYSLIHIFTYSYIELFIYSYIQLFTYSYIHIFTYSYIDIDSEDEEDESEEGPAVRYLVQHYFIPLVKRLSLKMAKNVRRCKLLYDSMKQDLEVQMILDANRMHLQAIYKFYASADPKFKLMTFRALFNFAKDFDLIPKVCDNAKLYRVFQAVNWISGQAHTQIISYAKFLDILVLVPLRFVSNVHDE